MKTIVCPICNRLVSSFAEHSCEEEVKIYINYLLSLRDKKSIDELGKLAGHLSHIALELPHINMKWVIDESVHLYYELWNIAGRPKELAKPLREYQRATELVAQDPYVLPKWKASILFTPSISKLIIKSLFQRLR